VTPGLRALLGKLTAFKVNHWGSDSTAPSGVGRAPVASLDDAQVISSLYKQQDPAAHPLADVLNEGKEPWDPFWRTEQVHCIAVDVDWPVHVVESSTPGNHHLYVEVGDGIPQSAYFKWLQASADIGLLQPGYVAACIARGHSDLRLPWVTKADTPPSEPVTLSPGSVAMPVQAAEHLGQGLIDRLNGGPTVVEPF
jgi:hypothetical protein